MQVPGWKPGVQLDRQRDLWGRVDVPAFHVAVISMKTIPNILYDCTSRRAKRLYATGLEIYAGVISNETRLWAVEKRLTGKELPAVVRSRVFHVRICCLLDTKACDVTKIRLRFTFHKVFDECMFVCGPCGVVVVVVVCMCVCLWCGCGGSGGGGGVCICVCVRACVRACVCVCRFSV